jgi:hypothetical protein
MWGDESYTWYSPKVKNFIEQSSKDPSDPIEIELKSYSKCTAQTDFPGPTETGRTAKTGSKAGTTSGKAATASTSRTIKNLGISDAAKGLFNLKFTMRIFPSK